MTPVRIKSRRLLHLLADRSQFPGQLVAVDPQLDYPLVDAGSPQEFKWFLDHLIARALIEAKTGGVQLTLQGWEQVDPKASATGKLNYGFIAMAFDPSLDGAYEASRAAITDCRFEPLRIDKVEHNEKICDRILADIRRSTFVFADFTKHRKGVYFEAGFAMGLGIPVIFSCQADDLSDTHFDTRQYNHIVWSDPADLGNKLTQRIQATVSLRP